jgi:protein-S-isoprenylcysteine O-methyltransferase Ste14
MAGIAARQIMNDTSKPSWIIRIPTPLWLIGLIIVALLIDIPFRFPALAQHRPTGVVLLIAGIALSAWGRLTFRKQGAEILPGSATHSTFVAAGPFRFTRNPMYLGLLVAGIGAALVAGTWLMWLVPVLIFVLDNFVIIPFEERSMESTFGDAYRAYKARVRRWI